MLAVIVILSCPIFAFLDKFSTVFYPLSYSQISYVYILYLVDFYTPVHPNELASKSTVLINCINTPLIPGSA